MTANDNSDPFMYSFDQDDYLLVMGVEEGIDVILK